MKLPENKEMQGDIRLFDLVSAAKSDGTDIVQLLKEHIPIVEVRL